jgi:hypothetical protein
VSGREIRNTAGVQAFVYGFAYVYDAQLCHERVTDPRDPVHVPHAAVNTFRRARELRRHLPGQRLSERRHAVVPGLGRPARRAGGPQPPRTWTTATSPSSWCRSPRTTSAPWAALHRQRAELLDLLAPGELLHVELPVLEVGGEPALG